MPELPEVTTVCRTLDKLLRGKTFIDLKVYIEKLFKGHSIAEFQKFLKNETIQRIYNIGKFIVWELTNSKILLSHLRMEGKFFFFHSHESRTFVPHLRAVFYFSDGSVLLYLDMRMFGTFEIRNSKTLLQSAPIVFLAKTPFEIDTNQLFERLKKSRQVIKTALLNQRIILGIGNVYADEILFAAKINPTTPCNQLEKKSILYIVSNAQKILNKAISLGGSSIHSFLVINNQGGNYQNYLQVYGRQGKKCLRCGEIICKIRVNNRGTHFCPNCQRP